MKNNEQLVKNIYINEFENFYYSDDVKSIENYNMNNERNIKKITFVNNDTLICRVLEQGFKL